MALNLALVVSLADKASRPLQRLGGAVERLGARADRVGRSFRGVGTSALPRLTLPVAAFGGLALRASGQMEQMEVGFTSMLGNAEKAGKLVDDLAKFSARTPFQLPGIGQAARQLLAMEVPQGRIIDNLQMIGDIAAGAQVPIEEMTQIYAKSLAKGKVQTEELNQLSERGIPILGALQKLAEKYGHTISKEDVFKAAEKGQIRFETLREALALLTAEGGVFHRQMELQSGTLFGLFSTLKDNAFLALDAIGDKIDRVFDVKGKMKRFTEWIQTGVEWFQRLADERPGLVKLGFAIAGIAAIAGPALIALGFMASGIGLIAGGLGALAGLFGLIFSPIGLFVAAIAGAAWAIYDNWDDVVGFFERTWSGIREAFPGAAQFFEDLWAAVSKPVHGMFAWVKGAWLGIISWLEGPGKDQSVFDWLSEPVVGLFAWVGRQWDAVLRIVSNPRQVWAWLSAGAAGVFGWVASQWSGVLAWIEAPDTDIWGWISAGAAGVFAWVGRQWDAAKALIETPASEIWSWLSGPVAGLFDWIDAQWLETILGLSPIGIALGLPSSAEAAAWAAGALASLTAAIAAIDFKSIGKSIGGAVRDGFLALMDLLSGDGALRGRVSGAFLSVLEGIGKLMVAVLRGALQLVIGFIDGVFRTDIEAAVQRQWRGIAAWVERNTGIDIGGGDAPDDGRGDPRAGAFDIWPAAPAGETIFGRGGAIDSGAIPAAAAARVGGEVRILVDDRRRVRVEGLKSDNPDVDLVAHTGFSMTSP